MSAERSRGCVGDGRRGLVELLRCDIPDLDGESGGAKEPPPSYAPSCGIEGVGSSRRFADCGVARRTVSVGEVIGESCDAFVQENFCAVSARMASESGPRYGALCDARRSTWSEWLPRESRAECVSIPLLPGGPPWPIW